MKLARKTTKRTEPKAPAKTPAKSTAIKKAAPTVSGRKAVTTSSKKAAPGPKTTLPALEKRLQAVEKIVGI